MINSYFPPDPELAELMDRWTTGSGKNWRKIMNASAADPRFTDTERAWASAQYELMRLLHTGGMLKPINEGPL